MRSSTWSSTASFLQAELSRAGTASWLGSARVTPCASAKSSRLGCGAGLEGAQLRGHCAFLPAGTGTGTSQRTAGRGGEEPRIPGSGAQPVTASFLKSPLALSPFPPHPCWRTGEVTGSPGHVQLSSCPCRLRVNYGKWTWPSSRSQGLRSGISNHFCSPQEHYSYSGTLSLCNSKQLQVAQTTGAAL